MKQYQLNLTQLNGRMTIQVFRDEKDKDPISYSRGVAVTQWDEARKELLVNGLNYIIDELMNDECEHGAKRGECFICGENV